MGFGGEAWCFVFFDNKLQQFYSSSIFIRFDLIIKNDSIVYKRKKMMKKRKTYFFLFKFATCGQRSSHVNKTINSGSEMKKQLSKKNTSHVQ